MDLPGLQCFLSSSNNVFSSFQSLELQFLILSPKAVPILTAWVFALPLPLTWIWKEIQGMREWDLSSPSSRDVVPSEPQPPTFALFPRWYRQVRRVLLHCSWVFPIFHKHYHRLRMSWPTPLLTVDHLSVITRLLLLSTFWCTERNRMLQNLPFLVLDFFFTFNWQQLYIWLQYEVLIYVQYRDSQGLDCSFYMEFSETHRKPSSAYLWGKL